MPTWTQDQLNQMGAVLAGTHDMLDPTPRIQPAYNVNDLYAGILPAAPPPISTANAVRGPTPAQLAAIQSVPSNSYQPPRSVPIQDPTRPNGFYQGPDTGNYGRASGAMLRPLDIAYPTPPAAAPPPSGVNVPLPRPRPNYPNSAMEDALIQAGIKPGIPMAQQGTPADPGWLKTSRQLAEVGFRQAAIQAANKAQAPLPRLPAPVAPGAPPAPAAHQPSAPPPMPHPVTLVQQIMQQYGASPSQAYDKANDASALAAQMRAQAMHQAGMMTPVQMLQMQGLSPSAAYDQANRNAQLAAIQRAQAARANGAVTPVQALQSQGMSPAAAYAAANAQAAARAQAASAYPAYSGTTVSGRSSGTDGGPSWAESIRSGGTYG